eukprot:6476134-Amphidinium_carterae.1
MANAMHHKRKQLSSTNTIPISAVPHPEMSMLMNQEVCKHSHFHEEQGSMQPLSLRLHVAGFSQYHGTR